MSRSNDTRNKQQRRNKTKVKVYSGSSSPECQLPTGGLTRTNNTVVLPISVALVRGGNTKMTGVNKGQDWFGNDFELLTFSDSRGEALFEKPYIRLTTRPISSPARTLNGPEKKMALRLAISYFGIIILGFDDNDPLNFP